MFVGLGNPGKEYEKTHHNMGYWAIDEYAKHIGVTFNKTKCNGEIAEYTTKDCKVVLVKPITYMNRSGECVAPLLKKYNVALSHLCVVYDDIDLNVGVLRMRKGGSPGTHNGMRNITELLGTGDFPRIRIGIGRDNRMDLADFVLSKVSDSDTKAIVEQLPRINKALDKFVETNGDLERIQI